MEIEWRAAVGYEGRYEVSNFGLVRGPQGTILKPRMSNRGYLRVRIALRKQKAKNVHIHRMVLLAFRPHPDADSLTVNHIDGNKQNNALQNLEFITHQANVDHAKVNGLYWDRDPRSLFTDDEVRLLRAKAVAAKNLSQLARDLHINRSTLRNIKLGKAYRYLWRPPA